MTNKNSAALKNKNIARIDQESKRSHGWYVRIGFHGQTHNKFFSDKKHGGKDSSLYMAIIWRNHIREKIGKPLPDKCIATVARNTTGVVGVSLDEKMNRYVVTWVGLNGRQCCTSHIRLNQKTR